MSAKKDSVFDESNDENENDEENVISLLGDEESQIQLAMRRSLEDSQRQRGGSSHPPAKKRIRGGSAAAAAGGGGGDDVICLLDSDDEDDGGGKVGACDSTLGGRTGGGGGSSSSDADAVVIVGGKNGTPARNRKKSPWNTGSALSASSGDVMILDEAPAPPAPVVQPVAAAAAASASSSSAGASPAAAVSSRRSARKRTRASTDGEDDDDDDEIEALGVANAMKLPHARHDCPDFKFVQDVLHKRSLRTQTAAAKKDVEDGPRLNPQKCDMCYCYICDAPAKECQKWSSTGGGENMDDNHCLASSKGIDAYKWKQLREQKKGGPTTAGDDSDDSDGGGGGGAGASAAQAMAFIAEMHRQASRGRRVPHAAARAVRSRVTATSSASSRGPRASPSSLARVSASRRLQNRLEAMYGSASGPMVGPSSLAARASPSSAVALALAARARASSLSWAPATTANLAQNNKTHALGQGPWPSTDADAGSDVNLTQCRRCKYFSFFEHKNYTRTQIHYVRGQNQTVPHLQSIGDSDWCHACGRIASEQDFGKEQSSPFRPRPDDVCLGTKEVTFRLRPHDPRKIDAFKAKWTEMSRGSSRSKWKYDAGETMHDLFQHRFGARPTAENILASVPILGEADLPDDGFVQNAVHSGRMSFNGRDEASATECEALLFDDRNDRVLLEELARFAFAEKIDEERPTVRGDANMPLAGDIAATWDKARKKGTFTIRLYARRSAFVGTGGTWCRESCKGESGAGRISQVLGAWFGAFPFTLVSLTNGIRAKEGNVERRKRLVRQGLPCPPWQISHDEDVATHLPTAQEETDAIAPYNRLARTRKHRLSFLPSNNSSSSGGVCSNDTSFAGTLRRYFSEKVVEDCRELYGFSQLAPRVGYAGKKRGIEAHHRTMRRAGSHQLCTMHSFGTNAGEFRSYLREEDHPILAENVLKGVQGIYEKTKTLNGLLGELENLGHSPAPHTEGLTIELLEFQKQAVGWALERENAPQGVSTYSWTKLPRLTLGSGSGSSQHARDLYFNPSLDMFSKTPPKTARGGFLSEQMGLGKTVISLAVVLQNPAPEEPISGSSAHRYKAASDLSNAARPGWTPTSQLVDRTRTDTSGKRASVFSRGTLVVCNVSLVGQWIDEAKSKLKDPGLVYSYHGGSRKRDASILAEKSIVVTTYATLASDAGHWAKKGGDGYCPPCEQVRWWRIICDESHVLKDMTKQTRSILDLVGENKWCVTGTPTNTSLNDLKNQMAFIGIENTNTLFDMFGATMANHAQEKGGRRRNRGQHASRKRHECGNYLFLMRSMLMRHSMEQKYRTTGVNLMSLPPKEERTITIPFGAQDRVEYDKLEAAAQEFYERIKMSARHDLGKHYLKISGALMPLRQACSGVLAQEDEKDGGKADKKAHKMAPGDDVECSICLENLMDPCATKCNHVFCRDCIEGILGQLDDGSGPCPMCRTTVKVSTLRKAVLPPEPEEEGDNGKKGKKKKKPGIAFKSKLNVLLRELERIRGKEPESKTLVFSQFNSTLEWLKTELPKHGFQFRTLNGSMTMTKRATALREFQNDPPTTIFLLSMRAGAVGINLTQANRIFLMEPAMNPALEAQAIGRVHRLGQLKPVEIIRLIMQNSVETRSTKLLEKKYGKKKEGAADAENKNDSSGNEDGTDEDDEDSAPTETAAKPADAAAGSLSRDKVAVTAEEFDLLFGCSS